MLLHEASHSVLHGPDSSYINRAQYAASRHHRGVAEVKADGAAFVLADHLGLDTLQARARRLPQPVGRRPALPVKSKSSRGAAPMNSHHRPGPGRDAAPGRAVRRGRASPH